MVRCSQQAIRSPTVIALKCVEGEFVTKALAVVLLKGLDLEKQPLREGFWHADTLASITVNLSAH